MFLTVFFVLSFCLIITDPSHVQVSIIFPSLLSSRAYAAIFAFTEVRSSAMEIGLPASFLRALISSIRLLWVASFTMIGRDFPAVNCPILWLQSIYPDILCHGYDEGVRVLIFLLGPAVIYTEVIPP